MTIEWWLPIGLIAPAIVAIALAVRRKSWFARRKYVVAIVMSAVSALLLAALAHPTIPAREPSTPRLIIVADVSASMVAAQDWREVAGWIESLLPAEVELTVIPFAGRPSERPLRRGQVRLADDGSQDVADSLWPGRAALDEMETNLQQALHMAAAVAGDDVRRSAVIVYSDGWWMDDNHAAAVEALRRRGLSVGALAAVKNDLLNARIVNLTAPARVDVGQMMEVEATIEANRDGEVELLLTAAAAATDSAPIRVGRTVNLQAGRPQREKFAWQPTSEGLATVTVGVNMPGDAIAGDDQWQLPVQVGLRRPLLLIHGAAGGDTATAAAARQLAELSAGERSAELTSAMNAPQTAAALGRYAAVVLVNVSRLELGNRLERALDGYVREMGGGLLVVGGGNAFGQGGYAGGLIDELLPLTSRTEHRPPIHLALVLDRSASMIEAAGGRQKLEIAKDAVGALERVLINGDRLSLVAFNHDYQVVLDTLGAGGAGGDTSDTGGGAWNRVRQAVAPLVPQGGTSLGPALTEALAMLERGPTLVDGRPLRRHVIVVSDGESDPFDIAAMTARAAREQISISVVATGGGQAALMELAARGSGRYYDAAAELADPLSQNRLAQIFMDDLPLELMIAEPSPIRTTTAIAGDAIHWPIDAGAALPPVPAYLVTQAKGRAAVHLEAAAPEAAGEAGNGTIDWHPLAASWQLGLGRAAALPVAADVSEAIDWLKLPQIAPGVISTIQWLASEDAAHADFEAVVRIEQGVLHAEVRQRRLPDAPAASPGMRLDLYSLETRRTIALPLKLVAPGHWRCRTTLSGGAYSYVLRSIETRNGVGDGAGEPGGDRLVASGTVSGGVAAELRHQGINGPALARLAETGGGGVLTSPAQTAEIELPQEVRRDLRPLLVVVAMMLLLGQLAADLLAGRRRS